jgi:hypothetical protein
VVLATLPLDSRADDPAQVSELHDPTAARVDQSELNDLVLGVSPATAVRFDLTRDLPDNQIRDARGRLVFHLGAFVRDTRGRAQIDLHGDLRRHDMGDALAESIDEKGTGAATFLTENLWGVGSTAPYLHDGRATTLGEAILLHGSEARASRDAFAAQPVASQRDVIAFLENRVLFKQPPAEEATTATTKGTRFRFVLEPRRANSR